MSSRRISTSGSSLPRPRNAPRSNWRRRRSRRSLRPPRRKRTRNSRN
ncbi:hypothetical protein ACFPRL_32195 [Pseudoclavibacter helvolus]